MVRFSKRIRTTFNCIMDFHQFPVDVQVVIKICITTIISAHPFSDLPPHQDLHDYHHLSSDLPTHLPLLLADHGRLHAQVREGRDEDWQGRQGRPVRLQGDTSALFLEFCYIHYIVMYSCCNLWSLLLQLWTFIKIKVDYDDDFDLALNGTIYPALKIKFFLKRRLTSHAMQVQSNS